MPWSDVLMIKFQAEMLPIGRSGCHFYILPTIKNYVKYQYVNNAHLALPTEG